MRKETPFGKTNAVFLFPLLKEKQKHIKIVEFTCTNISLNGAAQTGSG